MSSFSTMGSLPDLPLWDQLSEKRIPFDFELEITARCNNACRHCYINLPAGDLQARAAELTLTEIDDIASQAVKLGALWCLVTGGEPLLRPDFPEIYRLLKRKGLLISVFTNACLITPMHVELFRRYPPRDIEVSVYGVTQETYERVTQKPGSYAAFRRGLDLLLEAGMKVRLKAMALRSNVDELPEIARFCREHTTDYFRFDPLLHFRYDRDAQRNAEILSERLTPHELVAVEQADEERAGALAKSCERLISPGHEGCDHLFHCGAGMISFTVGYDGTFRLCSSLNHPDTVYNLRKGSLAEAWNDFVPQVREMTCQEPAFLSGCQVCPLVNLCLWCPANGDLETGRMDGRDDYFCQVAQARAEAIRKSTSSL